MRLALGLLRLIVISWQRFSLTCSGKFIRQATDQLDAESRLYIKLRRIERNPT